MLFPTFLLKVVWFYAILDSEFYGAGDQKMASKLRKAVT